MLGGKKASFGIKNTEEFIKKTGKESGTVRGPYKRNYLNLLDRGNIALMCVFSMAALLDKEKRPTLAPTYRTQKLYNKRK